MCCCWGGGGGGGGGGCTLNLSHTKRLHNFRKLLKIWMEPNMEITVAVCL